MSGEHSKIGSFPFHSRAEIQFRDLKGAGTLCDISLNGAMFSFDVSPEDPHFLRPCRLHVLYNGHGSEVIAVFNGLVVHHADDALGIKFIGVGEKERVALLHLIELNLAETSLLDRDVPALIKSHALLEKMNEKKTAGV